MLLQPTIAAKKSVGAKVLMSLLLLLLFEVAEVASGVFYRMSPYAGTWQLGPSLSKNLLVLEHG